MSLPRGTLAFGAELAHRAFFILVLILFIAGCSTNPSSSTGAESSEETAEAVKAVGLFALAPGKTEWCFPVIGCSWRERTVEVDELRELIKLVDTLKKDDSADGDSATSRDSSEGS